MLDPGDANVDIAITIEEDEAMKKWMMLGVLVGIFMGASEASAACKLGSAPVCADVRLTALYLDDAGVYIETDGDELGLSGSKAGACNPESGIYLWLNRSNLNYQGMLSTLLSAKLASSNVTIRLVPSGGEGLNLRCQVAWIRVS